jgi:hypothetical protein
MRDLAVALQQWSNSYAASDRLQSVAGSGMGLLQLDFVYDFSAMISTLTTIFLAHIMIELGKEYGMAVIRSSCLNVQSLRFVQIV